MMTRTYRSLFLGLALLAFTLDQASKYGVFRWLYNGGWGDSREVVPGWFKLIAQFDPETPPCECSARMLQTWSGEVMPRVNHGALFGMGSGLKGHANGFFLAVSVLASVGILLWGLYSVAIQDRWLTVALGLVLGGTLGNLYDRAVFNGVRDFLYFYKIDWPVFNVADCCLVVGAVMLLLSAVLSPGKECGRGCGPGSGEKPVPGGTMPEAPAPSPKG